MTEKIDINQPRRDAGLLQLLSGSLTEFRNEFALYIDHNSRRLPKIDNERDLAARVTGSIELQSMLFSDGWARCGWPASAGGLGGTIRHRAAMAEILAERGLADRTLFEHLEILAPTLCEFAKSEYLSEVMPEFLSGSHAWAQGFSEPDAGSDLAALRTTGRRSADGLIVTGRKIWTSWAKYARRCLVLVRTDSGAALRQAMTTVAIDLDAEGVEVRPIVQADGGDALAELVFDDVSVPERAIVGEIGDGWAVAMHILDRERGTFAFFRQLFVQSSLKNALGSIDSRYDSLLGDVFLDLAAGRSVSHHMLQYEAENVPLGPRAAVAKCLSTTAEQQTFDFVRRTSGPRLGLGDTQVSRTAQLQRDYIFSGIVSVYGGSREIQLDTIATRVLGLPR